MMFDNKDTIVFAGDSVTDAGRQGFEGQRFGGLGTGYVSAFDLDLSDVYKNIYESGMIDDHLYYVAREYNANCFSYNKSKLSELGLDYLVISKVIFNLLLSNGYQGYNFIDLSNRSDFKEIVGNNLDNFNSNLASIVLKSMYDFSSIKL